jgi:hypothetical protein
MDFRLLLEGGIGKIILTGSVKLTVAGLTNSALFFRK